MAYHVVVVVSVRTRGGHGPVRLALQIGGRRTGMARHGNDPVLQLGVLDFSFQRLHEEHVGQLGLSVPVDSVVVVEAHQRKDEVHEEKNVQKATVIVRRVVHVVDVKVTDNVHHARVLDDARLTGRLDDLVPQQLRQEKVR